MMTDSPLDAFTSEFFHHTLHEFVSRVQTKIDENHKGWEKTELPQPFIDLFLDDLETVLGFFFPEALYLFLRHPDRGIYKSSKEKLRQPFLDEKKVGSLAEAQWLECNQAGYPYKIVIPVRGKYQLFIFFSWNGAKPGEKTQLKIFQPISQALDQIFLLTELLLSNNQTDDSLVSLNIIVHEANSLWQPLTYWRLQGEERVEERAEEITHICNRSLPIKIPDLAQFKANHNIGHSIEHKRLELPGTVDEGKSVNIYLQQADRDEVIKQAYDTLFPLFEQSGILDDYEAFLLKTKEILLSQNNEKLYRIAFFEYLPKQV